MEQKKVVNVFSSAIVENKADCPDCHGSGEVWTWNDDYEGLIPSYCKCGVQVGVIPEPPEDEDFDDDDREAIQPGDYHYYNGA